MKKTSWFFFLAVLTACSPAVVASPTVTATNTLIPLPTITPTAIATATTTPVPNGPCDNPLVPLAIGNQWTYRVTTESGESLDTLESLGRQDGKNIVVMVKFTDQKNNVTVNEPVVCMDGAIENFPLFVMNMHLSDYVTGAFNTYHDTGIYAPSYQTLVDNNWYMNWDLGYLTEDGLSLRDPKGGLDLLVGRSVPINLTFELDGTREAVTIPAGSYPQAIKVMHSFSIHVSVFESTNVAASILTLNTTQWYEPYVGLVRAEVDTATLSFNKQEINLPIISTIELVEFTMGK